MAEPSLTCPVCNGVHFTLVEFRSYQRGNTIAGFDRGLTPLSNPIPTIVCLCGFVVRIKAPVPQSLVAGLQESCAQARTQHDASEERLQSWAAQLVNASELDKHVEDVPRLEKLTTLKPK